MKMQLIDNHNSKSLIVVNNVTPTETLKHFDLHSLGKVTTNLFSGGKEYLLEVILENSVACFVTLKVHK
jgi:hypothetical protein